MADKRLPRGVHEYQLTSGPMKDRRRYYISYYTPDHRRKVERGFRRVLDAQNRLAEVTVSRSRGTYVDPADARAIVGTLGATWLAGQRGHLKPSSYRPVESAWRIHVEPRWGRTAVGDVRFSEVQTWATELGTDRSATTVHRAYGVLAAILDAAVRDRRLSVNPARDVKLKRRTTTEHTYLSHQQVADLAAKAGEHGTLVYVLAYCGLRWGEATGLRVRDVAPGRRRLSIAQNAVASGSKVEVGTPKNHQRRTVPFPDFLEERMRLARAGKDPDALVFTSRDGGHLRPGNSKDGWFVRAVRDAGLPRLTPHDLRHTAASLAISSGANVKAVQRMLGHKSAAMTLDTYADLFPDDLDAVAEALGAARGAAGITEVSPAPHP